MLIRARASCREKRCPAYHHSGLPHNRYGSLVHNLKCINMVIRHRRRESVKSMFELMEEEFEPGKTLTSSLELQMLYLEEPSVSSRYSTRRSRFLCSMAMVVLPIAGKYIDARVLTSGLKFFSLEKLTQTAPGLIQSVSIL